MAYASHIGATVKRKEDPRLITGRATYAGDLKLPGMLHAAFVRSPYPHARILGIDVSAALQVTGVRYVVIGQELVDAYDAMPMSSAGEGLSRDDSEADSTPRTHYALSIERIRHVGEPVAVVLATSAAIAEDAAAEVVVDWDPLPAVADPDRALADGAPLVFETMTSNVQHVWRRKRGDTDTAFANAFRVVTQHIASQRVAGISMEGRAVVAAPDGETGGLKLWTSTQSPHAVRKDLAKLLHIPESSVHVIAPEVGGGFGVKIGIYREEVALAALARRYQVPIAWVESRIEHMVATTHGRAQAATMEAAVEADGTITGLRMRLVADIGAYPRAPDVPELTGKMAVGVYRIPAVDLEVTCVFTHTTPVAAYRGAGRPEAAYYIERMMDLIAGEMEMDPVEIRRKNFIPPDAFPYKTPSGPLYDSGEYERALQKALDVSGYANLREEQRQRRLTNADRLLGIGLSCYVEIAGFGYDGSVVRVDSTGTVTVFTGISPHGQGQETTFSQIVAEQLGVDFDQIVVRHGDTRETPMGEGTMGSRGLAVGGSALIRAVAKVQEKARRIAGHMLEAATEDIVFERGRFQVRGVPDATLTLAQIADLAYSDDLPDEIDPGLEATDFFKLPDSTCPFGAHVAVVEIERETGAIHIRDYFSVDDCGPRISPMLVQGQVHGGLAQGIGQALLEQVVYDEHGQLLTGSLMDYAIARAEHFPFFVTDQTVTPTPRNPLGVKGIGEAATIGSTPATVNAVLDALAPLGVRHIDMPLSPEKVWRAMQAAP